MSDEPRVSGSGGPGDAGAVTGEVDPAARAVIARSMVDVICPGDTGEWVADNVLAALAAEGYSVVKLAQPESGRLSRPLLAWLSPLDDNNDRHLVWSTEAHATGCEPLYRRVKGETT